MVRLGHVTCLLGIVVVVTACGSSVPSLAQEPASVSTGLFTFFSLPKTVNDPDKIEMGPDGALWLTQKIGHPGRLARITTAGAASTVTVSADSEPTGVTIGPDGALWYSALASRGVGFGRVGRVGDGSVSEVPLTAAGEAVRREPDANGFVDSIATGSDGALWFTALDRVGRLVPEGEMTLFPVARAEQLAPIIAGPDGALWTTDVVPAIWRITTSGSIRRFDLPTRFGASDLAFAGDGGLWFTSQGSPLVGRRDPSGRITTFRIAPDDSGEAESIAAGPDGAMWFTTSLAVNRITRNGEITVLEIPDAGREGRFPSGIATAPDGAIWFALRAGNRGEVARIDAAARRRLLVASLADRRFTGRRGHALRIPYQATRRANGVLRLWRGRHSTARRPIHAKRGGAAAVLRLPRRPGIYRLELRLEIPGQSASDDASLTVEP
jgi:virginiamycin B lyase